MVFGRSEMFFPRSKSYNLNLTNVESLVGQQRSAESGSGGINLIDDGRQIIAPSVNTGNLAFKELSYIQSSTELAGLTMSTEEVNGKTILRLRNNSHVNVHDIILYGPALTKPLKESLPVGTNLSLSVEELIRSKSNSKETANIAGWQLVAASCPAKLIVVGKIDSMHIGPNYGAPHPASQYLVISAPDRGSR